MLDQGLAPHAATILRRHGFDAVHVSDIGMERAEDVLILERARNDERVCITLDHDFHAHLAIAGQGRPSVVLLRIQGVEAQGQADLIRLYTFGVRTRLLKAPPSRPTAKPFAFDGCR